MVGLLKYVQCTSSKSEPGMVHRQFWAETAACTQACHRGSVITSMSTAKVVCLWVLMVAEQRHLAINPCRSRTHGEAMDNVNMSYKVQPIKDIDIMLTLD